MNFKSRCKRVWGLLAVLAVVAVVLGVVGCQRPERFETGRFDYQRIKLENGLEVITLEDFSCPIVAVQLWYHVGSKDEQAERQTK